MFTVVCTNNVYYHIYKPVAHKIFKAYLNYAGVDGTIYLAYPKRVMFVWSHYCFPLREINLKC